MFSELSVLSAEKMLIRFYHLDDDEVELVRMALILI